MKRTDVLLYSLLGAAVLSQALSLGWALSLKTSLASAEKELAEAQSDLREVTSHMHENREELVFRAIGLQSIDLSAEPGYAEFRRASDLRELRLRYADAMAELGLSSEQRARVLDLLRERNYAVNDARKAAVGERLNPKLTAEALRRAGDSVSDEIKALIGANEFSKLESFAERSAARIQLANCRQTMARGAGAELESLGMPASPLQLDAMAQAYSEALQAEHPSANELQRTDPATGLFASYEFVCRRVSSSLAPEQLSALRAYFRMETQKAVYLRNLRVSKTAQE